MRTVGHDRTHHRLTQPLPKRFVQQLQHRLPWPCCDQRLQSSRASAPQLQLVSSNPIQPSSVCMHDLHACVRLQLTPAQSCGRTFWYKCAAGGLGGRLVLAQTQCVPGSFPDVDGNCNVCGGDGGACCPGGTRDDRLGCPNAEVSCNALGFCAPCGTVGGPCCTTGVIGFPDFCRDPGSGCLDTTKTCVTCGLNNLACCETGEACFETATLECRDANICLEPTGAHPLLSPVLRFRWTAASLSHACPVHTAATRRDRQLQIRTVPCGAAFLVNTQ